VRPSLIVFERADRNYVAHARWWITTSPGNGRWKKKSMGFPLRFPAEHRQAGQLDPEKVREAKELAHSWHADLLAGREPGAVAETPKLTPLEVDLRFTLTIVNGLKAVMDPKDGKYPLSNSARRNENRNEMKRAETVIQDALGTTTTWSDEAPMQAATKIWRHVAAQFNHSGSGYRWAERVVGLLFTAASWLRDRNKIPADTCLRPENWRKEMRDDWRKLTGSQTRPGAALQARHSAEEARKILEHLHDPRVDPRIRLVVLIGATLRGGQVGNTMRSNVDLTPGRGAFGLGRISVPSAGEKEGGRYRHRSRDSSGSVK
jgi:hypothetical protein